MKRSKHSLSKFHLLSLKLGGLYPIGWYEVLPGDTIQQATSALIRCAPLVSPAMHPVHARIHHFFIPNRLIWQGSGNSVSSPDTDSGWESFITGGRDGLDATAHPYIQISNNVAANSLLDYLGLPSANFPGATTINVNALPLRAYQFVWNEYYRDLDLEGQAVVSTADGLDTTTTTGLQQVTWQKDYLTTARPWDSKGPSVAPFPSGAAMAVKGIGFAATGQTNTASQAVHDTALGSTSYANSKAASTAGNVFVQADSSSTTSNPTVYGAADTFTAQYSIQGLRHQMALLRFQEARARYGSRYVEYLRYLGIRSSDARLQRPEYLGGGTSTIQFSEVLQTAPTTSGTGNTGVGIMGGHGISAHRTNRYRRFFEEHGIVMSFLSVRPVTVYTQPIERKWLRGMTAANGAVAPAGMLGTKEDYWQRELQHLGSMQINGMETDVRVTPSVAWGYQDRYDEYRRQESTVAGQFRTTLLSWHFARAFGSTPSLNSTFVACVPATNPFQDTVNDQLYVMVNHSIQARRLVSKVGSSYAR